MPKITVPLALGIQPPVKLGTLTPKLTSASALAYAQNIDVQNDEYGHGVATPGPALTTITNNSTLTSVPTSKTRYTDVAGSKGIMFLAGGSIGATDYVFRIVDIEPSLTPSVDATNTRQVPHSTHANEVIDDIVFRQNLSTHSTHPADAYVYIIGHDDTDGWVRGFDATDDTMVLDTNFTIPGYAAGHRPKMFLAPDGEIYVGYGNSVFYMTDNEISLTELLKVPVDSAITDLNDWNGRMVIAYAQIGSQVTNFDQRKGTGSAGVALWDYFSPTFERLVPCPTIHISALVPDPDGSLLAFGGVSEGRTTLYNFNGFGFTPLVSYIGDMPRSRHSVDFDGQGRILWQTVDGQICRYDKLGQVLEHLGTITTGSSAGGIFARLNGTAGSEFLAISGTGSTYTAKRVSFGSFAGDGDAADGVTTPLVVSPQVRFPDENGGVGAKVTINSIELVMNGALIANDNLELRLYKNGSATAIAYGADINSTNDGTTASSIKREQGEPETYSAHVGVAFKATDARATSPGVISAIIDYDPSE